MLDDLDVLLQVLDRDAQLLGQFRDLMVLQQPEMLGDDLLGGRALEADVAELQGQTFLQIAGATPIGSNP